MPCNSADVMAQSYIVDKSVNAPGDAGFEELVFLATAAGNKVVEAYQRSRACSLSLEDYMDMKQLIAKCTAFWQGLPGRRRHLLWSTGGCIGCGDFSSSGYQPAVGTIVYGPVEQDALPWSPGCGNWRPTACGGDDRLVPRQAYELR